MMTSLSVKSNRPELNVASPAVVSTLLPPGVSVAMPFVCTVNPPMR
jgi:hypothetical protein